MPLLFFPMVDLSTLDVGNDSVEYQAIGFNCLNDNENRPLEECDFTGITNTMITFPIGASEVRHPIDINDNKYRVISFFINYQIIYDAL